MPELPEVETVRRSLENLIIGKKITSIDILYKNLIETDMNDFVKTLVGETFTSIRRRGKFLLIDLSKGNTIVSHLRMEGKYFIIDEDEENPKHSELVFHLLNDNKKLIYNDTRKFGKMYLAQTNDETSTVKGLKTMGPEPTEKDLSIDYLTKKLKHSSRNIKAFLLDQTKVAGIGNIYADEVLWLSKIHPLSKTNKLPQEQIEDLRKNIISELELATKYKGTTISTFEDGNGHSGGFQDFLHAYGKAGQKCEDGGEFIKIKVSQRGTTFCEVRQKLYE